MHKEGDHIVETPVEARGGVLGRPALVVLVMSVVLAAALLVVTYVGMFKFA